MQNRRGILDEAPPADSPEPLRDFSRWSWGKLFNRKEIVVTKKLVVVAAALVLMIGLAGTVAQATLNVQVIETGQISMSADGAGASASANTIQVDKPNLSATVRSAYLTCTITQSNSGALADGAVSLAGTSINWDDKYFNAPFWDNGFADVTSVVQPIMDSAGVGITDLAIVENTAIEGCGLYVIFNDPLQDAANTVFLLFGGQETTGDDFAVSLAEPLDPTDTAEMGLAISFGYQGLIDPPTLCGEDVGQYSEIDVNGQRMTTCAGNYDDKATNEGPANGNLITVGGIGDDPANPTDPFQKPADGATPRIVEDELYDLSEFLGADETLVFVETLNPSGDDNIFAGHMYLTTAAIIGEGITLAPTYAINPVGTDHTVTATVVDDAGAPVPGIEVDFDILSGPNVGGTGSDTTDAAGMASFTYTGSGGPGIDTIVASFLNDSQDLVSSNEALKEWTDGDSTPPECYLLSVDPGPPMAIEIFVQDTGSGLADISVLDTDNATVDIPPFAVGTTDPVIVDAGKIDQTMPAMVLLEATDVDGNSIECDPVLARMHIPANRHRTRQRYTNVPLNERFVTMKNDASGVRLVAIALNGKKVIRQRLNPNQEVTAVIETEWMKAGAGKNNIAIWAYGKPGGKVTVLLSDGVGTEESLIVKPEKGIRGGGESARDLTWGKRK